MAHYGSAFYDGTAHYDEADPAPLPSIKKMKVKLALDHLTHDELADRGTDIHTAMTTPAALAGFNAPNPPMTTLDADTTDLRAKIAAREAAETALTTAVQAEAASAKKLQGTITQVGSYVDNKANGNAVQITLAGFGVRKTAAAVGAMPKVLNLKLTTSDYPGAVDWMCKPVDGVRVYILQTCTGDPAVEANWHHADTQTSSSGTLKNLPTGKIWVRVLAKGADENPGPPSDPAEDVVR